MDEDLLKNWPEFHKFAQESLKSQGESSSAGERPTSLFLDLIQAQKLKLYEECGFETKVSEKLDEIIKKTEQFCLMETIHLYENFKQKMAVKQMASCRVKLDRIKEVSAPTAKSTKGIRKGAKRGHSSKVEQTPSTDTETEEDNATADIQELGRGKRKKIKKLKFDFEEESLSSKMVKESPTPQTVSSSSKKVCHSEPTKKESPLRANQTIRKDISSAQSDSKKSSITILRRKKLEQRKKKLNFGKDKGGERNADSMLKSPRKSKCDSSFARTKAEKTEPWDADIDMSIDTECGLCDKNSEPTTADIKKTMASQDAESSKDSQNAEKKKESQDIEKNNDSQDTEESKDSQGTETSDDSPKDAIENPAEAESSGEKVKGEGGLNDGNRTQSDGTPKDGNCTRANRVRKVRGPQKAPKKLPLNKIPMVCACCKTRFSAYATLRRHYERIHTKDEKFNPTNPPKHLLCIETGEEFNFVNLYLKHYRALFAPPNADKQQGPEQTTGSDVKANIKEHAKLRENGILDDDGNVSSSEGYKENLSGNEDLLGDSANHVSVKAETEDGTESNCEDIKKLDTKFEGNLSHKKASTVVRSRKGRGPQKTPKKFPWSLVPIVCAECKTRYSTYSTLRRHWTKCHSVDKKFDRANPPKLMLCTVCDETFCWPRQFLRHYREHAAKEEIALDKVPSVKFIGERTDFPCDKMVPITCSICKTVINGEGVIYSHWKKEHRTEPDEKPPPLFYCDQCGLSFDAPRKFRLHYRIHTGAKPHECEVCLKTFRTFSDLTSHMLCHNQSKEFKCEVCGKCFIAQKILNRHMKGHLFPHVCDVCGKSYPSKYSLNLHTKIHTGEKPHKCEFCGVAFIQAGSLKLHRRLHLGDKPHVCETCGMRFNSMSHLKTHIRVHTGEKPYKCDKCDYAAASSSRLKDHATVHKDEKPHVCKVPGCGRRYKRLSHLIFHHSKHAGVKPYVCKICGAAFKLSSELSLHKRQDACALHLKEGVKPEFVEDQPKEIIADYSILLTKPEDEMYVDNGEELKEETQTVYIYHDVEGQDGLQEMGDAGQQIIGIDGATHTEFQLDGQEFKLEGGQVEGQEEFEQQIVIQIVREPGHEDEDIVLSKEELERIVRLSQQI